MAEKKRKSSKPAKGKAKKPAPQRDRRNPLRWCLRWGFRVGLAVVAMAVLAIVSYSVLNPPTTYYMAQEGRRLDGISHDWADMEDIAPVMARSAVAAEDADFCLHWGFDMSAIRRAIEDGANRGASTISQQVVKNVYLWQGRNWTRKALEAVMTPAVEIVWTKRRILEVYLNVAEFDEGVFGVGAASRHYFGVEAAALSPEQAARLAAILPAPKSRSASEPSGFVRRRASAIMDGAATIRADGRSACFED